MNDNVREQILNGLNNIGRFGAKAESIPPEPKELLRATLPIPAHFNALLPEILLIIGGRGAGKSHLFRVLNTREGAQALIEESKTPNIQNSLWVEGYASSKDHLPDIEIIQKVAQENDRTGLIAFWRGLLIGAILSLRESSLTNALQQSLPNELYESLSLHLKKVSTWHSNLLAEIETVSASLDELDGLLLSQNRYLFITYDDLDVMAVEWEQKQALLQALLQFWLNQFRRWRRIRPKIFLRSDLFSPEFLQFPDAAKLEGNKMLLRWNARQLYQLVFKNWANQNADSLAYLQQAGLQFYEHPVWGRTYQSAPSEDALRQVVHQMIGQFMGAGPKKGRSFEWIPNHLQDANGEIFPRSILGLFSIAAEDEQQNHRAPAGKLLAPESLAMAIEEVSRRRIKELEEEYRWLESVQPVLNGQLVPVDDSQMAEWLKQVEWQEKPPASGSKSLIELLLKLGIFRRTSDGRLHVPDIYLFGFGLKRKGGIPRPVDKV